MQSIDLCFSVCSVWSNCALKLNEYDHWNFNKTPKKLINKDKYSKHLMLHKMFWSCKIMVADSIKLMSIKQLMKNDYILIAYKIVAA